MDTNFAIKDYTGGQLNALVKILQKQGGSDAVEKILRGELGLAEPKLHIIDCDADPMIPFDGWKVEEHKKGDKLTFDASKISLHLNDKQKKGSIEGNKLRKELADQPVLNANVLDYLMRNPQLIPDEWKQDEKGNTRYIFFWGTIYRHSDGYLCVRCLYWDGGHWQAGFNWLGLDRGSSSPAAVSAS